MKVLNGKEISQSLRDEARDECASYVAKGLRAPGLAVVQAGLDPASAVYVRNKEKACAKAGFASFKFELDENVSEREFLELIDKLNHDEKIDGILVQVPLPKQIDEQKVAAALDPWKDVDAFNPVNTGRLLLGLDGFLPCTPYGVMELLKRCNIELKGKNAVVLGRSNIVGKPQALLLLRENATVTICHSKTRDLPGICRKADILVSAMGRAKMIDETYVNPDQIVIDVAINSDENGKLCGDVDYEKVADKVAAITPVPGGVGPMTIGMLLKNTLKAYSRHMKLDQ